MSEAYESSKSSLAIQNKRERSKNLRDDEEKIEFVTETHFAVKQTINERNLNKNAFERGGVVWGGWVEIQIGREEGKRSFEFWDFQV
jgi:hypothetical protein